MTATHPAGLVVLGRGVRRAGSRPVRGPDRHCPLTAGAPAQPHGGRMSTQAADGRDLDKQRDAVVRCVGDAYDLLDLLPGVDPNGPVLVWLADQLRQLRLPSAGG